MSRRSPAWLPCPLCGSDDTILVTLRGKPRRLDGVALRGHECRDCRHRYVSIQRVIPDDELATLARDVA